MRSLINSYVKVDLNNEDYNWIFEFLIDRQQGAQSDIWHSMLKRPLYSFDANKQTNKLTEDIDVFLLDECLDWVNSLKVLYINML